MIQQLSHGATQDPGLRRKPPEGASPAVVRGTPSHAAVFVAASPREQWADGGPSPATSSIWFCARSLTFHSFSERTLHWLPSPFLNKSQRSHTSLQALCEQAPHPRVLQPTPPPTTCPLLPLHQTHCASGRSRHLLTSGPLCTCSPCLGLSLEGHASPTLRSLHKCQLLQEAFPDHFI